MKDHYKVRCVVLRQSLCLLGIIVLLSNHVFAQKIEIKDGVKYIHNEGKGIWADDENVRIEKVRTLGVIDGDDENFMFYIPMNITGDREGNIYVLDSGNHRIQKFDKNLNFVRTIGRFGQGPGEFMTPSVIGIDPDENINVYDSGNGRIDVLSPDGEYLRSISKPETSLLFRFLKTGEMIVRNPGIQGYRAIKSSVPLFFVLDSELKEQRTIGKSIYYGDLHKKFMGINNFRYNIDDQDNIYLTFGGQNRIEKYSADGKQLFVMDRPVSKVLENSGRKPPQSPATSAGGLDVDSSGRIWVLTLRKFVSMEHAAGIGVRTVNGVESIEIWGNPEIRECDNYCLELFSNDGVLLKVFMLDYIANLIKIIDDKIYVLDKLRGMQFHIYDIKIDR